MKFVVFCFATTFILAGCVSTPYKEASSITVQDRAAFVSTVKEHLECMGSKTRLYIEGSDDVALLTKHISSLCEPILTRLDREIQARGFAPGYAHGYVNASRAEAEKIATSGILEIKSQGGP